MFVMFAYSKRPYTQTDFASTFIAKTAGLHT